MSYEVDDNRYPATAVVYITARWGSETYTGSGFIVGENDVLTAAHVVYSSAYQRIADEIWVYPSYDPDEYGAKGYQADYVQYYPEFDPDADGKVVTGDFYRTTGAGTEIDIALLSMEDPIGSLYGTFGIDAGFAGGSVGVLGYPGVYGRQPIFDSGTVRKSTIDNTFYIGNDLEVNPGNSGGPIYYDYGNGPYAVGIVSTQVGATNLAGHWSWLKEAMEENNPLQTIENYNPLAIYRFYNASAGAHFYTGDKSEAEYILNNLPGFIFEGAAFERNSAGGADAIDVFRFYNTKTGTHFYTADSSEAQNIKVQLSYLTYEGVAYQAHSQNSDGTHELYRFYNHTTGTHFYTASDAEMEHVKVTLAGVMNYEGVAYYVDV